MTNSGKLNEMISVSEIKTWAACPRQFYFDYSGWIRGKTDLPDEKNDLIIENDFWREVCLELPEIVSEAIVFDENRIDEEKLKNDLKLKIEEIENDMEIMKDYREKTEFEEKKKMEKNEETLTKNVFKTIERCGTELYEIAADPIAVEKVFYFQKINLYGAPPKVLEKDGKLFPYFIKISNPPTDGAWESDRITAAAYLMLLESEFGKIETADFAIIDYFGDYRKVQIRPQDRKKVFRAVRKIREIKNGKMPKEKNIRLCQKCIYQKKCQVKAKSLFSKLFE